jgi:class 3 adenylate cyclase
MKRSSSVYRVYEKENDVKEMVGHHRDLLVPGMEAMDHGGGGDHASASAFDTLTDGEHIDYVIHIYPSDDFEASYLTSQPKIFALAVSLVFLVTVISFIVYDVLVEKRQKKLLQNAERSGKVVASLFPAMVRERLFYEHETRDEERMHRTSSSMKVSSDIGRLRKFMAPPPHNMSQQSQSGDSDTATAVSGSLSPIADLYNNTTVMFADIAGFTAWSSEREPRQVFQLLESLFCDFDAEAKSMKVFKIETIGDCYVAVTGLPEPTPHHAVIMARFAQRCLLRFSELTKELELSLGPGTADLGIRIGLHSGPVTAGVLRGEKARFQLFGDTMNTASRMESTSIKNMIQVTADSAMLLKQSGKGHTLIAREGLIKAKGKGYMQTYWLRPKSPHSATSSNLSERLELLQASQHEVDHIHSRALHDTARAELGLPSFSHQKIDKSIDSSLNMEQEFYSWNETGFDDIGKTSRQEGLNRLIKWNTQVLELILTKLVVQRNDKILRNTFKDAKHDIQYDESAVFHEEIATAVNMPSFDRESMSAACLMPSKEKVNLIPPLAREELRAYVARIASMYRDVHFHSFEHASHVTMSAQKLINKVVLRNSTEFGGFNANHHDKKKKDGHKEMLEQADLFFSTYGISADPLAQFAVVFAALVHDVEHRGVPNVQLIKEQPDLGWKYKNKSVAENNSIRIAWSELLKPEFSNLRRCIFGSDDDESRFRQLLINVVIATDITDKERRAGERERWQSAFLSNEPFKWDNEWQNKSEDKLPSIDVSLKATVVLEQIVLASDVAHTMQHWLTYVKWNERLYKEMWAAYASGRAEKDPTECWYKGEIGFFDGYIIPLATKLKECGVFGSAGDEYLGNALRNKAEWIEKGQAIVAEFEAKIKQSKRKSEDTSETTSGDS